MAQAREIGEEFWHVVGYDTMSGRSEVSPTRSKIFWRQGMQHDSVPGRPEAGGEEAFVVSELGVSTKHQHVAGIGLAALVVPRQTRFDALWRVGTIEIQCDALGSLREWHDLTSPSPSGVSQRF